MAEDKVGKILHAAFEEAYLERLAFDVARFEVACWDDPRLSALTAGQYREIVKQFKRFVTTGQRLR